MVQLTLKLVGGGDGFEFKDDLVESGELQGCPQPTQREGILLLAARPREVHRPAHNDAGPEAAKLRLRRPPKLTQDHRDQIFQGIPSPNT